MKEDVKTKETKTFSHADNQDIMALLKKLQYKLDSVENKIDSLIQESKQKTLKGKPFSKPHKEYDESKRHKIIKYNERKETSSGREKFYDGQPFGRKKNSGEGSDFKKKKRPFNKPLK
ncbi:MAG: hypothetical protein ACUZ8E_03360 [Candidatus Anammoxibacter sp.]